MFSSPFSIVKLRLCIAALIFPIFSFSQIDSVKLDSLNSLFSQADSLQAQKDILVEIANIYEYAGEWDAYEKVIEKMLALGKQHNDSSTTAEAYNKLGISNCYMGKNSQAIEYFQKTLAINQALNKPLSVANSYENIGLVYKDMAQYEKAIEYQIKSIEIREKVGYPRLFNNYMKLSVLFQSIGQSDKQEEYINKAKRFLATRTDVRPEDKAIFYNELGDVVEDKNLNDSAIVCYKLVIKYSEEVNWQRGIAVGLGNLAEIFYEENELDSAIFYHLKSLKLSEEIGDCISTAEELLFLARMYATNGEEQKVVPYLEKALKKAEECELLDQQQQVLKYAAEHFHKKEQYALAYNYLERHHAIMDSIGSADVQKNISELEKRYQTKVKEQKIELLTAENELKNQRILIFVSISALLLFVVMFGVFYVLRRRKQNQMEQEALKQRLLRSQMNPHFIFNALGSIQNFMYKNDAKKASAYMGNFASLMRSILNNSAAESTTLEEEIETLRNYLELEKMRMTTGLEYEILVPEELDTDFVTVPPMLLQPFIENAIKHGFRDKKEAGKILIKFTDQDEFIGVEIRDNGHGINHTSKQKTLGHKSMATEIFNKRMRILKRKFKKMPEPVISDLSEENKNEAGTKVELCLPVIPD